MKSGLVSTSHTGDQQPVLLPAAPGGIRAFSSQLLHFFPFAGSVFCLSLVVRGLWRCPGYLPGDTRVRNSLAALVVVAARVGCGEGAVGC